jgi:hypothetical protein
VAADIRAMFGAPRIGAVLLAIGALLPVGTVLTGLCPMRYVLAYVSTAALAITALGMALGWGWSRMVGRIVSWINVLLFSMLVVPDWDDAMAGGAQGLHALCGGLAVYFLLCAMSLGFSSASRVKASPPDRR